MAMAGKQKIVLRSCDGNIFELEESVAKELGTINNFIAYGFVDSIIPIPKVRATILSKVIEYCKRHQTHAPPRPHTKAMAEELDDFDTKFLDVDTETLMGLMMAAHYLDVKSLLDLTCKRTANIIKGKTTEQIRQSFNIVNDFSPEEEEQVCRETAWAFD